MNHELTILPLILNASLVVQIIIVLLLVLSVISWASILNKYIALRQIKKADHLFEQQLERSQNNLGGFAQNLSGGTPKGTLAPIFVSGMYELQTLRNQHITHVQTLLDGVHGRVRAHAQDVLDGIEDSMSFLATVASVSPYIGLFGTVWGIMDAFTGLASIERVSLATVAPGIAEALVATAMGLLAAIPAVIAYNRFSQDIDRLRSRMDHFSDSLVQVLQRSLAGQTV